MVKLSEQQKPSLQTSTRLSRTERVLQQQKANEKSTTYKEAQHIYETDFRDVQTLEEYEEKYNQLGSKYKPYFLSPSQLRTQQSQDIEQNKTQLQERIDYAKQQQQKVEDDYRRDIANAQQTVSSPEEWKSARKDIRDDYEEKRDYWRAYLQGLNEGMTKLNQNRNVSYDDIVTYAKDLGEYKETEQQRENVYRAERKQAYEELQKTSSFRKVFEKYENKYGTKIDWVNPKVIKGVLSHSYQETYPKTIKAVDTDALREQKAEYEAEKKEQYEELSKGEIGYIDYTASDTELPYQTRGTISSESPKTLYPVYDVEAEPDTPIKTITSKLASIYKKIPSLPLNLKYKPKIDFIPSPSITPIKSEQTISLKEIKSGVIQGIDSKSESIFLESITGSGIKKDVDTKYQEEYQARFYKSEEGKKAFEGEMDFEEASKLFAESKEAKSIASKYEKELGEQRVKQGYTKSAFKLAGLGIAKAGVSLIPTTTKGAVVEGALLYSGAKILKGIPTGLVNVGTAGIGTYGTITALDVNRLPEERAGGVITAGVSFGILGVQGVRYLRQPTIRTEKLIPKRTLEPKYQKGSLIKKDTKILTDLEGKQTVVDTYKATKLSEQIIQGRRTIVSTKFRDILGLKPIYEGIPTQQRGLTYKFRGLRVDYTYKTMSGYQKALKLLTKKGGLTISEAKASLKYYQPLKIKSNFKADIFVKYGDRFKQPVITIKGTRDITQPVEVLNERLGIKTKGAIPVREYISGKGTEIGQVGDRTLYSTGFKITKTFLTDKGGVYQKLTQAGKTTRRVSQVTSVLEKGDYTLKVQDPYYSGMFREFDYTGFEEASISKQIIPEGKAVLGRSRTMLFRNDNAPIINYDLQDYYGLKTSPSTSVTRYVQDKEVTRILAVQRLKDPKYVKEVLKTLKSIYGEQKPPTTTTRLDTLRNEIFQKQAQASVTKLDTQIVQERKFKPVQLKSILEPVPSLKTEISNLLDVKLKTGTASLSYIGLTGASATASASALREKSIFATPLKSENLFKELTEEDVTLRTSQSPLTAQAQALRQGQVLKFETPAIPISTPPSSFETEMPFYDITAPTTPTIPIFFPSTRTGSGKKGKTRLTQQYTYLPDFTARSLGLKEEILSEKQAQKRLKKILTGLEIRRPVKVKF